jgi:H+/Cl- antiporter ClcA
MDLQKAIEELGKQVGKGVEQIFPYYQHWFFVNAICIISGGVVFLLVGAVVFTKKAWFQHQSEDDWVVWWALCSILPIIIGLVMILGWLPDAIAPGGYAWQQVIKDIRK